jgi:hypothetical protein
LPLDRDPGNKTGVNDQVGELGRGTVEAQPERARLEPRDVGRAERLGDGEVLTLHVAVAVAGPQDVRVVVAEHGVGAGFARPSHHPGRVRTLGHEIADQHHPILGRPIAAGEQPEQLVETTVDIPDDERAHGRYLPRRGRVGDQIEVSRRSRSCSS